MEMDDTQATVRIVFRLTRGGFGLDPDNKKPFSRTFRKRMKGLEPSTFCMASRRSSQLSYIRTTPGV